MDYINKSANISNSGLYRYELVRVWDWDKPRLLYIMLNPSIADGLQDDATIRKCVGFADRLGFGSISVVNLFAYRATNPKELTKVEDPIGNMFNDDTILVAASNANLIIAAWGNMGEFMDRSIAIRRLLQRYTIHCLGVTKAGEPRHPLYLPYSQDPVIYKSANSTNVQHFGELMKDKTETTGSLKRRSKTVEATAF